MQYRVVNGAKYRAIRDEESRREQNREAKQRERERKNVSNVSHRQPPSAQVDVDVEVEEKQIARATVIKKPFVPDDLTRQSLVAKYPALNFNEEVSAFVDHHTAKRSTFHDWNAALRTWFRNADKWSAKAGKARGIAPGAQYRARNPPRNEFAERLARGEHRKKEIRMAPLKDE